MSEVVNYETGELVEQMSKDDARRITERIRLTASSARESLDRLQSLMTQAQEGGAHVALGYASWTAYVADVFSEEPLRLPRDQRQELVGYLAGEGMSVPAIAAVAGVADRTVQRDMRQGVTPVTTSPASPGPVAKPITGVDGKEYPRPEPKAKPPAATPPRRPLTDQFFDAAFDLTKAVDRVARLADDDRFPQNAEQVAAKHRNDLLRAIDALQGVVHRLPSA